MPIDLSSTPIRNLRCPQISGWFSSDLAGYHVSAHVNEPHCASAQRLGHELSRQAFKFAYHCLPDGERFMPKGVWEDGFPAGNDLPDFTVCLTSFTVGYADVSVLPLPCEGNALPLS